MVLISIVVVLLALLVYGSFSISRSFYLRSLCRNRRAEGCVAITFDDGVDPEITPLVLDILKARGAKATFFVIGSKAESHPELVRRVVAEGHQVGNHTFSHKGTFPLQSRKAMVEEIDRTTKVLERSAGVEVKLFRPPFGVTNPTIGYSVRRLGLISVGWSIRSLDTMGHSLDRVRARVARQLKSGKVILLHDNRVGAPALLGLILDDLDARGLRSVTITQLFNL